MNYKRIKNYAHKFINTLYYYLKYGGTGIIINSWNKFRLGRLSHRNFGDELNIYILSSLTNSPISNFTDLCGWGIKKKSNYLVIGSIVEDFSNEESIIWGSGAIDGNEKPLIHKPRQVLAVRGPLTRKYLLSHGVDCPEVYGDPALLLPRIYNPSIDKKHKLGIIPHVSHLNSPEFDHLIGLGAKLIRFNSYNDWKDVIQDILSCEVIVSSSLHGIIISDAYNIPNIWVNISSKPLLGGDFKFLDYLSSVHRNCISPETLNTRKDIDYWLKKAEKYKPIQIDLNPLINNAPWPITLKTVQ